LSGFHRRCSDGAVFNRVNRSDSSDGPSDPCRTRFMYQHNISHSWFLLSVVPLSTGVQSGEVFLSSPVPQLRCEVLLIPPSADRVVDPAGCLGA
ncbi:hypothetical protein T01_13251, partial [Trichinella spiralis]